MLVFQEVFALCYVAKHRSEVVGIFVEMSRRSYQRPVFGCKQTCASRQFEGGKPGAYPDSKHRDYRRQRYTPDRDVVPERGSVLVSGELETAFPELRAKVSENAENACEKEWQA